MMYTCQQYKNPRKSALSASSAFKIFFALLSIITISCKDKNSGSLLPSATGAPFDVLITGDAVMWRDSAGRALFDVLNEDMPGLPQSEPMFDISFIPAKDFSGIFKPVRNIVMFEINDGIYTQGRVAYSKNRWSKSQAIVKITAPNQREFIKTVKEKHDEFISFLEIAERDRMHAYFLRYPNIESAEIVYDMFGIQLTIPGFLKKYKTGEDFAWFSNGNTELRQDVIIYSYPYHNREDFKLENLLQKRDSVLKKHIEGPSPNSYMTTEHRFEITCKEMNVDGRYCVQLRGLWRVEGDMMGGPFVSRTFVNQVNNRIITVEGFVYAPSQKKRNYIRQLETVFDLGQF